MGTPAKSNIFQIQRIKNRPDSTLPVWKPSGFRRGIVTAARFHLATAIIGALGPLLAMVLMKLKGEHTMDVWVPSISDSGRQGAGYYIVLVSSIVSFLIRLWTREVIYKRTFWPTVRSTRSKINNVLMYVVFLSSHIDSVGVILSSYYSVGDNETLHNMFIQLAFVCCTLCHLLTALLFYRIDQPWTQEFRNVRLFAVAFSMWFMHTHANFPTENLRFIPYEEACMRLPKPLADLCLQSFADCEPVHYEWKRADGKPISAPYECYHANTFVRLPTGEKGELVRKTSLKCMDQCVLHGWIWAVSEILTIVLYCYAESMWFSDMMHLGKQHRVASESR